jgi:hypothetical protein
LTDQTRGEDKLGMASGGLPVQPDLPRRSIEPAPSDRASGIGNKGTNSPILRVYQPALPRFPCGEGQLVGIAFVYGHASLAASHREPKGQNESRTRYKSAPPPHPLWKLQHLGPDAEGPGFYLVR